jgi:hypothetical protein
VCAATCGLQLSGYEYDPASLFHEEAAEREGVWRAGGVDAPLHIHTAGGAIRFDLFKF